MPATMTVDVRILDGHEMQRLLRAVVAVVEQLDICGSIHARDDVAVELIDAADHVANMPEPEMPS